MKKLIRKILCYHFGHKWVKEQIDKEVGLTSWYCDRCEATDWETKEINNDKAN